MILGYRLRFLREEKNLSQADIEQRTGLLRCYISRVENGHTVPSVETLEKMARDLEFPYITFSMTDPNLPSFRKLLGTVELLTVTGGTEVRTHDS